MTAPVQSVTPKTTSQHICTWGGVSAMAGALGLYYFQGDGTLVKYLSLLLGGGGFVALCCGAKNDSSTQSDAPRALHPANRPIATLPQEPEIILNMQDVDSFLDDLNNKSSSIDEKTTICELRRIYNKQFKKDSVIDDFLVSALKNGEIHPGVRLAAADRLIDQRKDEAVDKARKDRDFGERAKLGENLLVSNEITKVFSAGLEWSIGC